MTLIGPTLPIKIVVMPEPGLWDEICIVTDLNLHILKADIRASGRAMGLMISQGVRQ